MVYTLCITQYRRKSTENFIKTKKTDKIGQNCLKLGRHAQILTICIAGLKISGWGCAQQCALSFSLDVPIK